MKVLVSGARGLIGTELSNQLNAAGHEVFGLSRSSARENFIRWNPETGELDSEKLNSLAIDAVVHLAGENIASGRWTEELKEKILESRIKGTSLLVRTIKGLEVKPRVFVSASAVGFYGDREDQLLDETSDRGDGFLAELCDDWERACDGLKEDSIRVVNARIGVVLSTKGGALSKMLPPFKLGLGGPIDSGKQYMSWITLKDVAGAIVYAIENDAISGPVNLVAPEPVTNAEFTRALGSALGRPAFFPMPGFAAKMVFGEMAEELLLSSTRVEPSVLNGSGFKFSSSNVDEALKHVLARR